MAHGALVVGGQRALLKIAPGRRRASPSWKNRRREGSPYSKNRRSSAGLRLGRVGWRRHRRDGAAERSRERGGVRVRVGTTKAAVDLFVALRTFLARGARFMVHKEKGTATTWVYYRSYRSVAGLMVPDTIEVEVGDEAAELRLDRIRVL